MATTGCSIDTPPTDGRCDDPAFRAANPDLCKLHPVLILQPSYAITEPGATVTYKAILRANGVEIELTTGLTWGVSNYGAATINPEGVATGVATGQTAISVAWQDLTASGQLDVVGSCAETNLNFRILIDNSASMGQAFNGTYATKLAFSKATAADFTDTINYSKDQVAVSKFGNTATELRAWTDSASLARSAINGIAGSSEKTNLADALQDAIDGFDGVTGTKVIVVFTDGEWSIGGSPVGIAQSFKDSGGFICVVATRAWGDFFVDLLAVASDGFLLSAYNATYSTILENLSGLKNFLCSGGGCAPAQNLAPYAELNYTDFINWDVTRGRVDLVGLGIYDVQPGNGLYVDLQGSGGAEWGDPVLPSPGFDFGLGQITSKVEYDFENGKNYSFEISVGGSLISPSSLTWSIHIGVADLDATRVHSGNTPLTPYLYEWTQVGDFSGPIIIEQSYHPPSAHNNVGSLIDEITLRNETDDEVMLYDNFDDENPTTIPSNPGYYGGCITLEPQSADPTPPLRLTE